MSYIVTNDVALMQTNYHHTSIDRVQYERDLYIKQTEHLRAIDDRKNSNWRPCMHDTCTSCHGTGIKIDGSICIHGISCPCPKCTAN